MADGGCRDRRSGPARYVSIDAPDGHRSDFRRSSRPDADARARARGLHRRRQGQPVALRRRRGVQASSCRTCRRPSSWAARRWSSARRPISGATAPARSGCPRPSGLHILTNTGYYGAANDKHLPAHAFAETAEQLAARWMREAKRGIDGTAIKPAFMKIGVDGAPLSAIDAKLVRAAALTTARPGCRSRRTPAAARRRIEELDLLERGAGAADVASSGCTRRPRRDGPLHARAAGAARGSSSTASGRRASQRHVELVRHMKRAGLLGSRAASRTTRAGITSASRAAAASAPSTRCSPRSCRR